MRHWLLLSIFGLSLGLLSLPASSSELTGTAIDGVTYTASTGILQIDGTISVGPVGIKGETFSLTLTLTQDNGISAIFEGGTANDFEIGAGLMTAEVAFIDATVPNYDFMGFPFPVLSYTLGGVGGGAPSDFEITGGSLAGIVSTDGTFALLLDDLVWTNDGPAMGTELAWYGHDFVADGRLEMLISPEPGTFSMFAVGLGVLGLRGRRARS
jgi:hypothetical protein